MIPYGRQCLDEADIQAVVEVLRSAWLTTGPKVSEFEEAVAAYADARFGVAVSSGTAALHCAMCALGIGPGDEVIVPPLTFAASANCVVFQGGTPVFADVEPETLLIDPDKVPEKITSRTRAIIAVDYAGHPCDYARLRKLTDQHGLALIDDACHALGAQYNGKRIGSLADMTVFSFHPVKHITTGEGGMIVTDKPEYAQRLKLFRNHGITTDFRQREKLGSWIYEITELGYNYRLTDIQCALGISQLRKLPDWLLRRQAIARRYDQALADFPGIRPLAVHPAVSHAYHLYVVRVDREKLGKDRTTVFQALREQGIGVNVHYIPVYLHPFYRQKFQTGPGLCPLAEQAYEQIISLPMFPSLKEEEQDQVIATLDKIDQ
jgi:perosamine synthetase